MLVEILEGMEAELRAKRRALDDDADDKDPNAIPDVASVEMPVDEAATFLRSVRSEPPDVYACGRRLFRPTARPSPRSSSAWPPIPRQGRFPWTSTA